MAGHATSRRTPRRTSWGMSALGVWDSWRARCFGRALVRHTGPCRRCRSGVVRPGSSPGTCASRCPQWPRPGTVASRAARLAAQPHAHRAGLLRLPRLSLTMTPDMHEASNILPGPARISRGGFRSRLPLRPLSMHGGTPNHSTSPVRPALWRETGPATAVASPRMSLGPARRLTRCPAALKPPEPCAPHAARRTTLTAQPWASSASRTWPSAAPAASSGV
jgi:hypothetical protein